MEPETISPAGEASSTVLGAGADRASSESSRTKVARRIESGSHTGGGFGKGSSAKVVHSNVLVGTLHRESGAGVFLSCEVE